MSQLLIKPVTYTEAIKPIQNIRITVFQDEQGVDPALEFDGLDETCEHLLAYLDEQVVGTTRIRQIDSQTAKIERLAVLKSFRGQGIGTRLMLEAIEIIARNKNYRQVIIHAQEYVKPLYDKLRFEQIGNRFDEAGIPHVKMIKMLER